jgi:PAS domain S-box-containing protein
MMRRTEMPKKMPMRRFYGLDTVPNRKPNLFDTSIVSDPQAAMDFIANILESSTEYSVIAKDLTGKILLWNEGARRLYGYEPDEVVGKMNSSILHTPEDVKADLPRKIMQDALDRGKFEGTVARRRKSGERFTARLVITPRRGADGEPIGFLLISKDISDEIRMAQYARSLIEASLDPLVTISGDGKITDVNEATVKVTGVPRDKLIGTDFSNYFTEPEKAQEGYRQVFAKGMVTDYPLTIRHAGGDLADVLYNASVYRDERGTVLGVFAAARDVTAQKQASEYARSLIEASLDPLVTISADGKITDVNAATAKVTGVPREKLIGTDFSSYFTEPDKAQEGYRQVFAQGMVTDYPLTIRHANGRLADVLYNASVYRDERGNVLGIFAAARDVTAQKQASQYARSLIEASLDPLVTISADGKITDVNEATVKVTGAPRDKLIGTDFSNYFTEPAKAQEGYRQVFAKGMVTDYPLTIRHVAGRLTDVLYNASVYRDERGNVLGVFAAARDVTVQKQAEAQIADQRAKELERLAELERFQKLTMGRELRMIELKKEIEDLKKLAAANAGQAAA